MRYKVLVDKLFFIIWIPTVLLLAAGTVISAYAPLSLLIMVPVDIFTLFFLVSPLFGYVELREGTLYIKLGLIMKREISYEKIRAIESERRWYSYSMLSLKCALDHVNVRYNSFDVITVSVKELDSFVKELSARISAAKNKTDPKNA